MNAIFSDPTQMLFLRTLANLVLSGVNVRVFSAHEGAIGALLRGSSGRDGRVLTKDEQLNLLASFALLTGWTLFGDFLVEASDHAVQKSDLRGKVAELTRQLTASAAGNGRKS